jgi:hypothetical protein
MSYYDRTVSTRGGTNTHFPQCSNMQVRCCELEKKWRVSRGFREGFQELPLQASKPQEFELASPLVRGYALLLS